MVCSDVILMRHHVYEHLIRIRNISNINEYICYIMFMYIFIYIYIRLIFCFSIERKKVGPVPPLRSFSLDTHLYTNAARKVKLTLYYALLATVCAPYTCFRASQYYMILVSRNASTTHYFYKMFCYHH